MDQLAPTCTNEFRNLFLHTVHGLNIVSILVKVLSGANILEILESLLLFLGPENATKYVKNAVQAELRDDAQEPNYFSTLSVGARVANAFGRLSIREYARQALGSIMLEFYEEIKRLPATSLQDSTEISEADKAVVTKYVQKLVEAICNSAKLLPKEFVMLCHSISEVTDPTTGQGSHVAQYLFTEVLFPIIAQPVVYGILEEPPTKGRALWMVTKVLQNVASDPDFKEGFLEDMQQFIIPLRAPLYAFLDTVVSEAFSTEELPGCTFIAPITMSEARQNLYSTFFVNLNKIKDELCSMYSKSKLSLIYMLLSNAIDSIAPEEVPAQGPIIMSPPFPSPTVAHKEVLPPPSTSSSPLSHAYTPPTVSIAAAHQRAEYRTAPRLSFLTLKREKSITDKMKATLMAACKSGDVETVKEFYKGEKTSILETTDRDGRTPLVLAALHNNYALVKWLLQMGCNINHKDNKKWSALHYACCYSHDETLRTLMSLHILANDEVNTRAELAVSEATSEGYTPLSLLLSVPPTQVTKVFVRKLVSKGANINALGPHNATPLISSVMCGSNIDLIRFLLEAGADPAIPAEFPATYWATKLGEEGVIRLFSDFGFAPAAKEVVDEKFTSLNLQSLLNENRDRRNIVMQQKKEIDTSKQEEEQPRQVKTPKRANGTEKHKVRPRENSFFSGADLMRLNPIPQPLQNKEPKRRARLTPKRRAELLDRKVVQAHDIIVHLEFQIDSSELLLSRTTMCTIPATMTISALMKKCQMELFSGVGIKWDQDEWHLFVYDEIPVAGEKQLWECDLDPTESMTLRIITPEEKEALKDMVYIKLIIPPVNSVAATPSTTPSTRRGSTDSNFNPGSNLSISCDPSPLLAPQTPSKLATILESSSEVPLLLETQASTPGGTPQPSPRASPRPSPEPSPQPARSAPFPLTTSQSFMNTSPNLSPNVSPQLPKIQLPENNGEDAQEPTTPKRSTPRANLPPISIQLPNTDDTASQVSELDTSELQKLQLSMSTNSSNEDDTSQASQLTPGQTPKTHNEKLIITIKVHTQQNLNLLLTDVWDKLPIEIRDHVDLWGFYLYNKSDGTNLNGELPLSNYGLEFFDIITLKPSPIFAFDVLPEEPTPFFLPLSIPPIVINSEATVKDTVNVLIQWVAKHSPRSVNQYAMTSSASTPALSSLGLLPGMTSAGLPPLPSNSPTLGRKSKFKQPIPKIPTPATTTSPRGFGLVTTALPPNPRAPPMPSYSTSNISFPPLNDANSVVRSASADSATGLGGSVVAAVPRMNTVSSFTNVPRPRSPRTRGKTASSATGVSVIGTSPINSSLSITSASASAPQTGSPIAAAIGVPRSTSLEFSTLSDTDSNASTSNPSTPRESPRPSARTQSSPRNRLIVNASLPPPPPDPNRPRKNSIGGASSSGGSTSVRGTRRGLRANPELLPSLGITPPPIYGSNLGLVLYMREAMCWMMDSETLSSYNLIPGAIIELREKPLSNYGSQSVPELDLLMIANDRNKVRYRLVWSGDGQISKPLVPPEAIDKSNLPFSDAVLENPKLFMLPGEETCVVNEVKLVFLGDGHSGKSSLLQCLKKFSSPKDKENIYGGKPKPYEKAGPKVAQLLGSTFSEGLDIEEWMFSSEKDQKHIVFHSWDFVTQDGSSNTQQFFLAKGAVYVIVFNIVQERDANIEYWLEMIQTRARGSPVLLCGTHLDDKRIPKHTAKIQINASKYFQKFHNMVDTSFVGCKSNKGIWQFAAKLVETVTTTSLAGNLIPISYIKLRKRVEMKKMEALAANNLPIMSLTEFKKMAAEFQIENKAAMDALQYLHRSGSLLYLGDNEPALSDTVFLDCQWLIRLMGTITTSTLKVKGGILTRSQLEHVWRHYSQSHYEKMLALMEQFHVLLRMPETNTYLIPTCIPEDRPSNVRENWPPWEDHANQSVRMFEFQFLPHGFLGRLMVRILAAFVPVCYWKSGLLVKGLRNGKDQEAKALIEYNPSLFRVKVSVRYGSGSTQGFTRTLWETIHNFTNAWYHNRQRSVLIECPHCLRMHSYDPFIFDLKNAEKAAAEGSQYVYCRGIRPVRIDQVAVDVTLSPVNHMTVPFEALQINELIGQGSYATVYKGMWRNRLFAIKQIDLSSIEKGDDITQKFGEFRREVLLMSGLEHPNIVALKGICLKPFCMITEYLPHGDLKKYLDNVAHEITWNARLKIAVDIAQGINFLHSATPPIIHRDLKSPNILIGTIPTSPKIIAKVADFGLSIRSTSHMAGREVWNISWLAPEVMKSRQYSEKVDVYSFGMILWELYTRQMPFEEYKQQYRFDSQLEDEIKKGLRPTIPLDVPLLYRELIEACWGDDPASRPTFEDILQSLKKLQHALAIENEASPPPTPTTPVTSIFNPWGANSPASPTANAGPPTPAFANLRSPPSPLLSRDTKSKSLRSEDLLPILGSANNEISFVRQSAANTGSVQCMILLNDVMWCGLGDGTLARWDIDTYTPLPPAKQEHSDAIYALLQVGNHVWSSSKDATMALWEKNDVSKPVKVIKIPGKDFVTCFLSVGKCVWTGSALGSIKQWSTKGKIKKELSHKGIVSIGCMTVVKDQYVWVGTERLILVVDSTNFTVVKELDSHKNMIHNIITVDTTVWTCSSDKTMKVWSLEGELLKTIEGHSGRVFCLMHVGNHVWSGSWDKSIFVWDKQKYSFLYELKGHFKDTVSTLVPVERDGKVVELWCGSWDKTICNYEYAAPPKSHTVNKILMEGYLMKESSHGVGKRKRYFILYKRELLYFESSKDTEPIFTATLVNTNVCVSEDESSANKRHVFTVTVGSHKFVLYCDSEQEYKNWIHALKSVSTS